MDAQECKDPFLDGKDRDWITRLLGLFFDFAMRKIFLGYFFIGQIVLFFVAWYAIVYAVRFTISLLMPFFVVLSAVFVVRCLHLFESKELMEMLWQAVGNVADVFLEMWGQILDNVIEYTE